MPNELVGGLDPAAQRALIASWETAAGAVDVTVNETFTLSAPQAEGEGAEGEGAENSIAYHWELPSRVTLDASSALDATTVDLTAVTASTEAYDVLLITVEFDAAGLPIGVTFSRWEITATDS